MIYRHTLAPFMVTLTFLFAAIGLLAYATHVRAAADTVTVKNYPASGGGTISGEGIDCGGDCSEYYADGATVTLTTNPAPGRVFAGWDPGGSCRTQGATCQFSMDTYYGSQITAYWGFTNYTVNVVKEGSGSGTVTGGGGYGYNATATLTATPASGSVFAGWQTSGSCGTVTGKGQMEVNMNTTCQIKMQDIITSSYTAVVKFDVAPATSSGGSTGGGGTSGGSSTPTPSTTTTPPTTTTTTESPVKELAINGQTDVAQSPPTITENTITLSGKTTPNAEVTLYIFSEPQTIKTKADGDGVWTATVAYIENGEHRVEAEVVDPTTGQTSARTQIAAFTVAAATPQAVVAETAQPAPDTQWLWYVVGAVVLLLGAAVSGIWWVKKHKQGPGQASEQLSASDSKDDSKQ